MGEIDEEVATLVAWAAGLTPARLNQGPRLTRSLLVLPPFYKCGFLEGGMCSDQGQDQTAVGEPDPYGAEE